MIQNIFILFLDGSMYIYDRFKTPDFKSDGINWIRKKSAYRVREDFVRISINGVHTITGMYTHAENNPVSYCVLYIIHIFILIIKRNDT